jgi:predicted tellurium resistance membrane protein TerC
MDLASQFTELLTANGMIQLLVISILEVVLGIDNLIFISLTAAKIIDRRKRKKARMIGLALALVIRAGMLFAIAWLASAQKPLFYLGSIGISLGNLVMLAGGLFLLYKTIFEIREKIYEEEDKQVKHEESISLTSAISQIIVIDFVFSFDSILAAIKLAQRSVEASPCPGEVATQAAHSGESNIVIMFSEGVSKFISQYPSIKMLALAFLLIIAVSLILDCFHLEIPKPYVYAALAFSILVETLNIVEKKVRRNRHRIQQEQERKHKGFEE